METRFPTASKSSLSFATGKNIFAFSPRLANSWLTLNTHFIPSAVNIQLSLVITHCSPASTIPWGSFVSIQGIHFLSPYRSHHSLGVLTNISRSIGPLGKYVPFISAVLMLNRKKVTNMSKIRMISSWELAESLLRVSFSWPSIPYGTTLAVSFLGPSSSVFTLYTTWAERMLALSYTSFHYLVYMPVYNSRNALTQTLRQVSKRARISSFLVTLAVIRLAHRSDPGYVGS